MRALAIAVLISGNAQAQAKWMLAERVDEFDDQTTYLAETKSDRPIDTGGPGEPQYALLQLRCDKKGGPAYWRLVWPTMLRTTLSTNQFAPTTRETSMEVRFDEGRILGSATLAGAWPPDPPVGVTQSVSNAAVKAILGRALKAKIMRVRDTSWDGRTLTAVFSLEGLTEAVTALSSNCSRLD